MSIESQDWRKYERRIHEELGKVYKDCEFVFDDKIFGKFSKIDRQIDISIRGEVGGNKILGIVDCKYFSSNIDVKIVESFLGMIEDVKANFGLIITNRGYSKAAKNRVEIKNLKLDILEFNNLKEVKITLDYLFNKKINNLELSKFEFFKRCKQNWGYFDEEKSSYEKKIISFKDGWANTEYCAFKKIIKGSARIFRDFKDLSKITIKLSATKNEKSNNWKDEKRLYSCRIQRRELEEFLKLNFSELREDIKLWRSNFLENKEYSKESILNFADKYVKSKKIEKPAANNVESNFVRTGSSSRDPA